MSETNRPEEPMNDNPWGSASGMEPEKRRKKKEEKEKKPLGQEILEWVLTLLVAVIAALAIRSFIFEPVKVDGASMNDTLVDGEVMFVSKLDYSSIWLSMPWQSDAEKEAAPRITAGFGSPSRYDVVICRYPGRGDTNFVKRLIGMPGDTVKIENGYVWINGERQEEPYISDEYRVAGGSNGYTFEAFQVPKAGDPVQLKYMDESHSRIALYVNDTPWRWRGMSSAAVSADGDRLVYEKDALLLNGTDISTDLEAIGALVGKEFTLEKDCYFVMGDHRNNSNDSRSQGPITRDMLVGHVRFVFFPFSAWRGVQ